MNNLSESNHPRVLQTLVNKKAKTPLASMIPLAFMNQLPETGYVRLPQILGNKKSKPPIPAIIPVGKSTWWDGVKSGRFPKPIKLGKRITAWRVEDIRALINQWPTLE